MKAAGISVPLKEAETRRQSRWPIHTTVVSFQIMNLRKGKSARKLMWLYYRVVEMHMPMECGKGQLLKFMLSVCFWGSVHICITLQHVDIVDDFLDDLAAAVTTVSLFIFDSLFYPLCSAVIFYVLPVFGADESVGSNVR
jgi:hypothetical protein